jgi:Zn-dependent protease
MKRFIGYVVAAITAALNWWVFYTVAVHFHSQDPWFMATALLVSVVVHELGHLSVLEWNGIRTYLVFLVVLGGAIPDSKQRTKFNELPWNTKAALYLAGVFGNLLVVAGGLLLYWTGHLTEQQCLSLAYLNGTLVLFNLLPITLFDGGRFAKVLFDSVPESRDHVYVFAIWFAYATVAVTVSVLAGHLYTTSIIVLLWGLHIKARNDDPTGSYNHLAMTAAQTRGWATTYLLLLAISLALTTVTESWMF